VSHSTGRYPSHGGYPNGEVRAAWHAKEVVRSVTRLGVDLQDDSCPFEVQRLDRTITNWVNYRTRAIVCAGKPNWSLLGLNSR
jgi:hypothetical protein